MLTEKEYINNIPIEIIKTKKFKNIIIDFVFFNEFSKENTTAYSILTNILSSSSKKYNTKKKLLNEIGKLYDTSIDFTSTSIYKTRITIASLNLINPKYANESLLFESINFLYEMLMNPLLSKNKNEFDEKIFLEEKRVLESEIKQLYDNKSKYTLRKLIEKMCPDEMISVSSIGTLESLESITFKKVYEAYLELLNFSQKKIYVIGDIDESKIKISSLLSKFNKLSSQNIDLDKVLIENKTVKEIKEYKEIANINQCNLALGYRTFTSNTSHDYETLQLFCTMYGGMFSSSLFQVVREKNSLCYSIGSSILGDAKIMIIEAGIDKENYQRTLELIKEELDKYKQGLINEELLKSAKLVMTNDYNEIADDPGSILFFIIVNSLLDITTDINKINEKINKITKEDIVRIANKVKLDTIYLLSN